MLGETQINLRQQCEDFWEEYTASELCLQPALRPRSFIGYLVVEHRLCSGWLSQIFANQFEALASGSLDLDCLATAIKDNPGRQGGLESLMVGLLTWPRLQGLPDNQIISYDRAAELADNRVLLAA